MALIAETQDDHDRMRRVLDNLLARRVDAIIMVAAREGHERLLRKVGEQVPIVLAVRSLPASGLTAEQSLSLPPVLVPRHSTLGFPG